MNKRLIVVNLLLIILLSVLPTEKELLATEEQEVKQLAQELFNEKQISRSLEEPRETEPQIVIATEISQECIDFINMQRKELQKSFFSCGSSMFEKNAQFCNLYVIT